MTVSEVFELLQLLAVVIFGILGLGHSESGKKK